MGAKCCPSAGEEQSQDVEKLAPPLEALEALEIIPNSEGDVVHFEQTKNTNCKVSSSLAAVQEHNPNELACLPKESSKKTLGRPGSSLVLDTCEEDSSEHLMRISNLSLLVSAPFSECSSASREPSEMIRLMKQRSCELLEFQETLLSRGSSRQTLGKPNFTGIWKCVDTFNLNEFLKACGVNKIQRMAAVKAPWPWWSMEHESENIHFINHGPLGDVEEWIDLSGKEYISYDGKQQKMKNVASWNGDTLVIVRDGPLGVFREERIIDDGTLSFTLTVESGPSRGASWGRTFEWKDPSTFDPRVENSRLTWFSRKSFGW